jgi:TPP-dependent trihydroxycyclohexane-1,2-dione (THcHDO) dehydratase
MTTVRLTAAQAMVRYLAVQLVEEVGNEADFRLIHENKAAGGQFFQ